MGGNKLLSDKSEREGSPNCRNRSGLVTKAKDPIRGHIKTMSASDARKNSSSKKTSATPMKMLIAQELLKETEAKQKHPSIIARLMGLDDAMPVQEPIPNAKRNSHESYPRSKSVGAPSGRKQQGNAKLDRSGSHEILVCSQENDYKDVYAVCQQPSRANYIREHAPPKDRVNDNQDRKIMALVREKFMEAKRLATDEKLLNSKEFQDALEVLSSNRDLFLKFLEEPNSLFVKHTKELQSVSSPQQTKRITLLKPSTYLESKDGRHMEKKQHSPSSGNEWETGESCRASNSSYSKLDSRFLPTRIVVLRPSPTKLSNIKATTATPSSSTELRQHTDFYRGSEITEAVRLRQTAREISQHMEENVSTLRRDESLLSSVSNGYVGDDSSGNEYMEDGVGNFSDSEFMSPISRNSWDYNNRIGSPYSPSSFSRTSYSPESSVLKEARKRLSERWTSVASKRTSRDREACKSCGTLGEMLAIPEVKKKSFSRSFGGEYELMAAAALAVAPIVRIKDGESCPRTLSRSQSVPVSASAYQNIGLQSSDVTAVNKSSTQKVTKKSKNDKSSFKGKLSSFFSWNKKSGRQKAIPSPLIGSDSRILSGSPDYVLNKRDDLSTLVLQDKHQETLLRNYEDQSSKYPSSASRSDASRYDAFTSKVAVSPGKLTTSPNLSKNEGKLEISEISSTNHDQPSPTSILEALFEDDAQSNLSCSSEHAHGGHLQAVSRSTPIESIARSLSWDDVQLELPTPNTSNTWRDDEEHTWFMYYQTLVSTAGLDNVKVDTVLTKWLSPESPLDPSLLHKIMDPKEEGAKNREKRSSQRLLFDCVNAALQDVYHIALLDAYPWASECRRAQNQGALVAKEVWSLVKSWHSSQRNQITFDTHNSSLIADALLRKDVSGTGWAGELMRTEVDVVSGVIEAELLEELLCEALFDISSECL